MRTKPKSDLRPPQDRLVAVIDIGSNSVRLVVFKGLKRLPDILFNERVLCGLGRSISSTGRMDNSAMSLALSTLRRFAELCADMAVDDISAMATAAVRDAENGPDFVRRIEEACGFEVRVLSGKKEARLSAKGVLSGFPGARGIAGDLGGGSLELIRLTEAGAEDWVSLPIGPLRLMGTGSSRPNDHIDAIKDALDSVSWLAESSGKNFYMVGGAWRAMARLHMIKNDWPLPVLHGYSIRGPELRQFSRVIARQSTESLAKVREIADRRVEVLPLAASILREVMKRAEPDTVHTSANGIREGLMYHKLNHAARAQDPLLTSAKEMADRLGRFPEHAGMLMAWIDPLFRNETGEDRRLRHVACLLSDTAWQAHPDFRAESALYQALLGRYTGIDHRGRALLALALYTVYGGPLEGEDVKDTLRLLSEDDIDRARVIGKALRLGQRLAGGTTKPLEYSALRRDADAVVLCLPPERDDMAGEVVRKRLMALAEQMGLEPEIEYWPDAEETKTETGAASQAS